MRLNHLKTYYYRHPLLELPKTQKKILSNLNKKIKKTLHFTPSKAEYFICHLRLKKLLNFSLFCKFHVSTFNLNYMFSPMFLTLNLNYMFSHMFLTFNLNYMVLYTALYIHINYFIQINSVVIYLFLMLTNISFRINYFVSYKFKNISFKT